MTGLEIELNLVNEDLGPKLDNKTMLEQIADEDYQTELARYNIELNVHPRPLPGDSAFELERRPARLAQPGLRPGRRAAHAASSRSASCRPSCPSTSRATGSARTSATPRSTTPCSTPAARTSGSSSRARRGSASPATPTRLAPESACTSIQLHLQVQPERFADHWNAAQVLAGPQLALGANSPFFLGQRLWAETRIPLFTQATDTRSVELKNQGVRPRVWFGERWITSIFDLFEENVRYFPALLPEIYDEQPEEVFERGEVPELEELRLHNGTVYRWNRPIYDTHRRPAPPARREPRAAGGPEHRRRHGQRRLLLRHDARPRRGGPPGLDPDELLGRRGELRGGRPPRHRRPRLLARLRRRARRASSSCAACCRWPTRALEVGRLGGRARPLPRHRRAALPQGRQRRLVADRRASSASRPGA